MDATQRPAPGRPPACAQIARERDAARQALEDLSDQRSLVLLYGTEAELEEHDWRRAAQQARHDEAVRHLAMIADACEGTAAMRNDEASLHVMPRP
jgi:hypothetical protein